MGQCFLADAFEEPVSGKREGRGVEDVGAGPGEPLEMEVERGRPRVRGGGEVVAVSFSAADPMLKRSFLVSCTALSKEKVSFCFASSRLILDPG